MILWLSVTIQGITLFAQQEELINKVELHIISQFWMRMAQYNPGSTIYDKPIDNGIDLGIRRFRIIGSGQLSNKVFLFCQIGINNLTKDIARKSEFFLHDAFADYRVYGQQLHFGIGLGGWTGFSRFSSPSIGSIMSLDTPLYQQATNDVTDIFVRKMSVFARGHSHKWEYMVALAQPFSIQKSSNFSSTVTHTGSFSSDIPHIQINSYIQYQKYDQEINKTPYRVGTYLGNKKLLNIGIGLVYQKKAINYLNNLTNDTVTSPLFLAGLDVFGEMPLSSQGSMLHYYFNLAHTDFGPNYLRNLGVMNPTNGVSYHPSLNGTGVSYPVYGTGNTVYMQIGYLDKNKSCFASVFMPYGTVQISSYKGLHNVLKVWHIGVNILPHDQPSKFSIDLSQWPVFDTVLRQVDMHRHAITFQYQISI